MSQAKPVPRGRTGCTVGEVWHSQDGRRGGLARECGYPAWRLVGLDSLGFWVPRVTSRTGVQCGRPSSIPDARAAGTRGGPGVRRGTADGGLPKAVGREPDVRLSLLRAIDHGDEPRGRHVAGRASGHCHVGGGYPAPRRGASITSSAPFDWWTAWPAT